MILTINNKVKVSTRNGGTQPNLKNAKEFLLNKQKLLPFFRFSVRAAYNAAVIEFDDEDKEDFFDLLDRFGFEYESDD
jgi:hypothetical protein